MISSLVSASEQSSLNIAVASNFRLSAQMIAEQFTSQYGIKVNISSASTATLYQQILRGAPFDVFLSADQKHVDLLIEKQHLQTNSKQIAFNYAQGRLAFWQPNAQQTVTEKDFLAYNGRLAIANPKFAPYGIAAKQTLQSLKKWQSVSTIQGNNINQAYQFVDSKNASAGLVSYAALIQNKQHNYFLIPRKWHQPIIQTGVIVNDQKLTQASLFQDFLLSNTIQNQIQAQGYN